MQKILKFAGVGIIATLIDYIVYQIALNVIFGGNLTFSAVFSGVVSTFAAYVMHNNITWKTRDPGRWGIVKFFLWNFFVVAAVRPVLVWIFGLLTGLYQFAFGICEFLHIPFSYEFVASTGVYVLMTAVTMTLNFIFYEKLVFGKGAADATGDSAKASSAAEEDEEGEQVKVKSVRKAGKETKSKSVS